MKRSSFVIAGVLAMAGVALGQSLSSGAVIVTSDGQQTQLALASGLAFHETPNHVAKARLVEVPGSAARLACWEEISSDGQVTPYYAISLDGQTVATVRPTSYALKLHQDEFDPLVRAATVEADLAADASTQVFIVQFLTQPLEEFRAAIEACGGKVYKFVANHAYLVRMGPAARDGVAKLPFVRWIGAYHPAYRLENFLRFNRARAGELFASQRYRILLFERGDCQKYAVADRIEALGGTVDVRNAGRFLMEATLAPEQLYEVIRWDEVQFVDRWSSTEPDMDNVRIDGGANYLNVAGYDGTGVRGEILDVGFCPGHVDFASRPLIQHGSVSDASHGCSTSGIIFGDGTGDPTARGMCPAGQGIISMVPDSSRYDHFAELLDEPYWAVFTSMSTGGSVTTEYTTLSADTDDMLFDLDIVSCNSQSNTGSQLSRPEAWAKNIVSCGAVSHYNTLDTADDCWCDTASIGPAADGRIKPDLAYWNDDIHTTDGAPAGYTDEMGGTSAATPIVAGHFGLFFQMWSEGIFGNPVVSDATVFENRPHMTTAKAVLINTANQYEFTGASHDLCRVHQGWGRPSVASIYDSRSKMIVVDETELLRNFETYTCQAYIAPAEPAARFTLVFADPAGVPSAAHARINDLSLRVVSPTGVEYWGNNGLAAGNWSEPGGEPDTINTVENVFVRNPEPGTWMVTVIASEINEDGHVETPELDADFALVITGTPGFLLRMRLPNPPPERLAPGQPTSITVAIDDGVESYVPGSAMLHYSYDGGAYQTAALNPLEGDLYEAILPPATCSARPHFYFSAVGNGGTVVYNPPGAPEVPYTAGVGVRHEPLGDDFEQDLGWTVWNDPSLTSGAWQRGVPVVSTQGNPPQEDYDGSGRCYLTQNVVGGSDVDGGPTRLISPLLDLSGLNDPVLQYARWWANDDQDADPFELEASSDGGATWVMVQRIRNVPAEWVKETVHLEEFIPLTNQVRVRFSVRDVPNNSQDEAAVDAVRVFGDSCIDVIVPADMNCDGSVNTFDIDPFVLALTNPEAYAATYPGCSVQNADCNGDGLVNTFDIDPFVQCLTSGCSR